MSAERLPEVGQVVRVRNRHWAVAEVLVPTQEFDLDILGLVARKVETIRRDQGSAGEVLAQQLEEAMLGRRRAFDDAAIKVTDDEQVDANGKPTRWWQREPIGGSILLALRDGPVGPVAPAADFPEVVVRGTCIDRDHARMVSLFLVNGQENPSLNRDTAWLFQPELVVEGIDGDAPFIGRHEALPGARMTKPADEATLEMLYRHSVEFATGHGVSVHAVASKAHRGRAEHVRTVIVPRAEVARTEAPTPGTTPCWRASPSTCASSPGSKARSWWRI